MKIGDSVYVHGYVDEIRKDSIIIRNDGGYFGTIRKEVIVGSPMTILNTTNTVIFAEETNTLAISIDDVEKVHRVIVYNDDWSKTFYEDEE